MKAFVEPPYGLSRAMTRVSRALRQGRPTGVEFVDTAREADFVLLHVTGIRDMTPTIENLQALGQRYGVIQYCLETSGLSACEWLPIWKGAEIVWSYYDLQATLDTPLTNFYRSPLGVDANVFRPYDVSKRYAIATSGYVMETEGVLEAVAASKNVGSRLFHLGPPDPRFGDHVDARLNISDELLAAYYSACDFVAGLRRIEGFELPAAEGLLCGVRPIMFDRPHYTDWFRPFALFIPERSFEEVTRELTTLFQHRLDYPVTASERDEARERFDWQRIVSGFWSALGNHSTI
jgi:hypothetical protein